MKWKGGRKRKTCWDDGSGTGGGREDDGHKRGTEEAEGTSRAQAILRTTQPLGGRTNCVGAQSRATRVEEGGKRLHNYPIQRTYPNPPFPRSLSLASPSLSLVVSLSSRAQACIKPDTF